MSQSKKQLQIFSKDNKSLENKNHLNNKNLQK